MRDSGFHPFGGRVSKHFGDQLSPDDAYLSYHDVRLTKEDMDTLKDDWLTDNCISFWEEYLEREYLTQYRNSHIVLLRPSMSFLLMQTPDPSTLKDALPDFSRTTHIFLPINDCRNVEQAEGGSHWSLLLVSVVDGVSFHYDSLSAANFHDAQHASNKISQLLCRPLRFINLDDSPQQTNSSDCGVFVCVEMKHLLLRRLLQAHSKEKINMSMGSRLLNAASGRKEMLKVIEDFRKEGERRRSRSASPYPPGTPGKDASKSRSPPRID